MKVLLVRGGAPEDSTLLAALQVAGYEVVTVSNGLEALERIERESFDAVITDSFPPRVDTLVLCRELRDRQAPKRIPVLLYTSATVDPGAPSTAGGLMADALIVGPVEPAALSVRIEALVREFAEKAPPAERRAAVSAPDNDLRERGTHSLQQRLRWLEEANRELTAREAYLHAIIENEPECVKLVAPDGSLLEMNAAGLRMIEADSLAQAQNRNIYSLIAEEDRAAFRALTEHVWRGESGTLQFRAVGLKGGRRWLETHASPLRDATGVVIALLGITRDITERKRVYEQLKQSTERFQLLAKATNDAVWDWDFANNTVWWGEGFELLFGYRRADVEPGAESWYNRVHPDDRERVMSDIHALIDSGGQMWSGEYRFKRHDESYAEIFDRGFVIHDAQGKAVRMVGVMMDITERKRANEALRASEERLRLATEGAALGTWHWNIRTGELVWSDRCRAIYGIAAGTPITYENSLAAIHPEDRPRTDAAVRRALEQGSGFDIEHRSLWPDGTVRWVAAKGHAYYDDAGDVQRMEGVVLDITERKRAEQALRESEASLQAAQEHARLGNWELELSTQRGFWSREMFRLFDRDPALGEPTFEEFVELVHPDDRPAVLATHARIVEIGGPANLDFRSNPARGLTRYFEATLRGVFGEAGKVVRLVGTLLDITERKRAEDALRQSERTLATLISNLPGMVYRCRNDPAWTVLFVSDGCKDVTGYDASELEHNRVVAYGDVVHPQDRDWLWQTYQVSLDARMPCDSEYRIIDKSGRIRWVWERGQGIYDVDGKLLCIEGFVQDVTARRQAEERVQRQNRVFAMLSGINALIVRVHDRDELFTAACQLAVDTGQFLIAWIGLVDVAARRVTPVASAGKEKGFLRAIEDRLSWEEDTPHEGHMVLGAIKTKEPFVVQDVERDARVVHQQAHAERGIRSAVMLPLLANGEVIGVMALGAAEVGFFDAEEMRLLVELAGDIAFALDHIEKEERINYLAYYDSLTGLANSTLFQERLTQFVHVAERAPSQLAVCIVDLDHFKTVNDALGRQAGDAILMQLAQRLIRCLGDSALVARLGADRFALVSPDIQGEGEVLRLLDKAIPQSIGEPFWFDQSELRVSAKIGVALYPSDGAEAETLFRNAEAALKKAKAGGDRYLFYTQQMTDRIAEKLDLENRMRRALEREEFVLYYQPKVDTQTQRLVGVEALIRWADPTGGLVPPMNFIPLLEETGIIVEVGAWVIRRAAEDYRYWRASGIEAPRIAVNVSAVQLRQRDFVDVVRDAINHHSPPALLELEITESLLLEDIEENIERLKTLHALGVSIAIDDFGTGYSSLGYLTRLPAQVLKIDLSFIARMLHDPDVLTLVSTMISLAHSMRLKVVAEGVETKHQADVLRGLQCDALQGYLIGAPVPREEITELLRKATIGKEPPSKPRRRRR